MRRWKKQLVAGVVSLAMVLTAGVLPGQAASAAAKKPTLSATKVTVKAGKSKTVKVKSLPKGAKLTKATWTSKKKAVAKVSKSTGKSVKIIGVKKGSTTVTCKVTYKQKKKKKSATLKVNVTVQKAAAPSATTAASTGPAVVATPVPTPVVYPTDRETSNLGAQRTSANGIATRDNGLMRTNWTSKEFMKFMGLGWNYGNSLEQSINMDAMTEEERAKVDVNYCETSANNVALTQENVDALKLYGFKNIRIPVAWSNMIQISEDKMTYTVNEAYLNRVEEVINYCLNAELYVIVNIHYDGDWWGQFGDKDENIRKQAWARYEQIWTQVANRYKEYSDRLIFESANEELGDRLNDDWVNRSTNPKTGVLTVDEQYETLNAINQKFVDIVRASGGNNASRYLLIAGYSTSIDATCDSRFKMPTDTAQNGVSKLSVSVHYYGPWNYCGGSEYHQTEGMAPRRFDWGSEDDIAEMHANVDKMKQFTNAGYGVIVGEFGVQTTAADGIPTYIREFSNYSLGLGMSPVFWDNGGWFDREKNVMRYDDIGDTILGITGSTAAFTSQNQITGRPNYTPIDSEEGLTLKFTWEGEWKKNGGGDMEAYCQPGIDYETDGWKFHCNEYFYWAVIESADFASFTQPYIRITCKDGDMDGSALQYAYATFKASAPGNLEKCTPGKSSEIPPEDNWSGQIFAIDPSVMKDQTIFWVSASNKPVITKIEIFDGPEVK